MGWERYGYTSEGYTPTWHYAVAAFGCLSIVATVALLAALIVRVTT